MKNKFILWGAVAVGAYLIWKRMNKDTGKELAPPPVGNTRPPATFGKPPINTSPAQGRVNRDFVCPTKEQMARSRYTAEAQELFRINGCLNN
jgi:hypothetical protein